MCAHILRLHRSEGEWLAYRARVTALEAEREELRGQVGVVVAMHLQCLHILLTRMRTSRLKTRQTLRMLTIG